MKVAVVVGLAAALTAGAVEARADDVTFRMGTYVWLPSVKGPLGLESDRPTPTVGDGNILDNLHFFGFGVAELSGDRFGALADFAYVDIGFDRDVKLPADILLTPNLDTKALVGTVSAYYRVVDGENWDVDLTGGVRGFWLETDFTLTGPNTTLIDASGDTNWFDGVIGARARGQYGNWGLTGLQLAGPSPGGVRPDQPVASDGRLSLPAPGKQQAPRRCRPRPQGAALRLQLSVLTSA
jgi:hypothetical protein